MKSGDIVIKMGDHDVPDMMGYMKALGMFKKGDKTTVTVLRDGKEIKVEVHFK
ncbi:MAG: PDZ domain-containing protein [Flavobacteriales bacterium]|nr:PDZ domain-containing protein [Flavobacteriales bacterium]